MTESQLSRLTHPERAKLIPVTGTNDQLDLNNAVEVQFNPTTLKVSLSNTLRANERSGSSRSSQFVDKSSSSLSVELIFDTTYIDTQAEEIYAERARAESRSREAVGAGSDVRLLTKRIAEHFIKPVGTGRQMRAPKRCLFRWGAFEFVGLVESFEETLDFFSPEGRPLRATVALKLSEDRFQFRNRAVAQAERDTPTLSPTGNTAQPGGGPVGSQDTKPVQQGSADQQRNWRDTALYNGVENPRLPSAAVLALPSISAEAGIKGSVSVSASATAGIGGGRALRVSAGASAPAFRFGASGSLGTGIAGAFTVGSAKAGLSAGSIISGGARLRSESKAPGGSGAKASAGGKLKADAGVGFD